MTTMPEIAEDFLLIGGPLHRLVVGSSRAYGDIIFPIAPNTRMPKQIIRLRMFCRAIYEKTNIRRGGVRVARFRYGYYTNQDKLQTYLSLQNKINL